MQGVRDLVSLLEELLVAEVSALGVFFAPLLQVDVLLEQVLVPQLLDAAFELGLLFITLSLV